MGATAALVDETGHLPPAGAVPAALALETGQAEITPTPKGAEPVPAASAKATVPTDPPSGDSELLASQPAASSQVAGVPKMFTKKVPPSAPKANNAKSK